MSFTGCFASPWIYNGMKNVAKAGKAMAGRLLRAPCRGVLRHSPSSSSFLPLRQLQPDTTQARYTVVHDRDGVHWKNALPSFFRVVVRSMCKEPGAGGFNQHRASTKTHEEKKVHAEKKQKKRDVEDEKKRVLDAALTHVPTLGWTEAAIAAGARDVNLSPAILGAFPRKEAALVEYFMDECLEDLVEAIEEQSEELDKLILHERLAKILRMRLEMQAPYVSKWSQALSIQANPINLPVAMKQRAVLMDEIWHAVGDRSTDWDWYTKRAILGGVYTAAEVYMLTDYSPGFRDTWAFLERRVIDAMDCRKTANEAAQLAQAIGAGLGNTIAAFLKQPRSGPF